MIQLIFTGETWDEIRAQIAPWQEAARGQTTGHHEPWDEIKADLEAARGPNSGFDSPDIIVPESTPKSSQREIRAIVESYMTDPNVKASSIRKLMAVDGIDISPQSLGGYMSSIMQRRKVEAGIERTSDLATKAPESLKVASSPAPGNIPQSEPEKTIYGLLKQPKFLFPYEIRAHLRKKGYHLSLEEIDEIIRRFKA